MKKFLSLIILFSFLYNYSHAQLFRNDTVIAIFAGVVDGVFTKQELASIDTVQLVFNTNKQYKYKILQFTLVPSYNEWCMGSTHVEKISFCNKISHEQRKIINSIPVNSSFSIESVIADINGKIIHVNNSINISVAGYQACIFRYPKKIRETYFSAIDSTDKRKRNIGKETLHFSAVITKKQLLKNKFIMIDSGSTDDKSGEIMTDMQIMSYNFLTCIQSSGYAAVRKEIPVNTDKITPRIKWAIRYLSNGDYVYFYNIKAKKKDGTTIDVGFLKLKIID